MSDLNEYIKKRDFNKTPEPSGETPCEGEGNRFVIQRHLASREHYDFRCEVGNVLVSWAIPKQPVMDPEVKRLAVRTENHPLDYIHFEGNIPKGNYGAGTVMVWDHGYYFSSEDRSVLSEAAMQEMLNSGKIKVYLQGTKLRGNFYLVKLKQSDKEQWLFMIGKYDEVPELKDRSALTGKTMDEISSGEKEWKGSEQPEKQTTERRKDTHVSYATRADFPSFIPPMLATPVEKPFTDKEWIFELKLDGYRLIATRNGFSTELYSRNGNNFNDKYPLVWEELAGINANFVIDGEICYMHDGKPDFQKLQNDSPDSDRIHYYVFDILWLNGHDLKDISLIKRKGILEQLLENSPPHVHFLAHVERNGNGLFEDIQKRNMEGIMAKKAESSYYENYRSREWLKIKTRHRQEMAICGFVPSTKKDREFKSLLCAVSGKDGFIYTGRVGTGFSQKQQEKIMRLLQTIVTTEIPVQNPPTLKDVSWVKPEFVCELRFSEWTKEGVMRHSSFIALRTDKKPEEIKIEEPETLPSAWGKVQLTNPDKIFWPDEKIRKRDVFQYYENIAGTILPYLKNRPQSLYRTPDGIQKKGFFQKNVENLAPMWADTVKVGKDKDKEIEYLLCQDVRTLLFMVNLGCIELNPWSASIPDLDHPDLMVFDLDPVEIDFTMLVDVALQFKQVLDSLSIPAYCKTSGSRGLHIFVPVKPDYTYKQIQKFVKTIQTFVHKKMPEYTSFERSPSKRKGKIYLDYLQNGKGKTMSSAYSLRPRPGALVSTPLKWSELNHDLRPAEFNIHTLPGRIKDEGDLWAGMLDNRVNLKNVIDGMGG